MSPAERTTILHLIHLLPEKKLAIELGCYTGGFLRHLSKHFKHVTSFDLTHEYVNKEDYQNVTFVPGYSMDTFWINNRASFILIDGDHSYRTVMSDLGPVSIHKPCQETIILIHDSWYGPSRKAIIDSHLERNPYIHRIDLDLCSGSWTGSRWVGGLCIIHMLPIERTEPLVVTSSESLSYKQATK